jgi:hypothetical protein
MTSSPCRVLAATFIGVIAGLPLSAQAQLYRCQQDNGTVAFQGTPCPSAAKPPSRPTAASLNAQRASTPSPAKPYDDPYASSPGSRAQLAAPTPPAAPAMPAQTSKSTLVAEVQARNARDAQAQANQQAHAHDPTLARQINCQTAMHNVDALRQQRPVYSLDQQADRHFIEDADRPKALADAQRQMADACN